MLSYGSRLCNNVFPLQLSGCSRNPFFISGKITGVLPSSDSQIENAEHDSLCALDKDSYDLNTAKVVIDFLLSRLQVGKTYYLVLDGLDELVRSLAQLYNKHISDFKILYAGRPKLEKELWRVATPKYKIQVTKRKVKSDIDYYIIIILGYCLEEG
ncbi:hypothetical protein GB937_010169 [Aspergillus fischeri]|nr:hypothetical protein GB937_010169 [Aspergillus fischeri]